MSPQHLGVVLLGCSLSLGAAVGCHRTTTEAERRASEQATAAAEEIAQEASLTSATLETEEQQLAREKADEAARANSETIAAFQLEQADFRRRLQRALDVLDKEIAHPRGTATRRDARVRELRGRRDLLKADLQAVDRSTDQDWATLRTKVERDLETGRPGTQLVPRTDRTSAEAP
jgi:hypothetical protein